MTPIGSDASWPRPHTPKAAVEIALNPAFATYVWWDRSWSSSAMTQSSPSCAPNTPATCPAGHEEPRLSVRQAVRLGRVEEHIRCENGHGFEAVIVTFDEAAVYGEVLWDHHGGQLAVRAEWLSAASPPVMERPTQLLLCTLPTPAGWRCVRA
jgi:hypothetical protein